MSKLVKTIISRSKQAVNTALEHIGMNDYQIVKFEGVTFREDNNYISVQVYLSHSKISHTLIMTFLFELKDNDEFIYCTSIKE